MRACEECGPHGRRMDCRVCCGGQRNSPKRKHDRKKLTKKQRWPLWVVSGPWQAYQLSGRFRGVISTDQRNILFSNYREGVLKMKQRRRIYYNEAQKALMWDRWQKGDSMHAIARLFDRGHSSVQGILSEAGGIRPAQRRRSRLTLTLAEREEISRGVVAGQSPTMEIVYSGP